MRILYVGDLNPNTTCRMRFDAMKVLGHEVNGINFLPNGPLSGIAYYTWGVSWKLRHPFDFYGVNSAIIREVRQRPYDVLWIDKGNSIRPSTLRTVRELSGATKIVGYSPDDMAARHNNSEYFLKGLRHYDLYLTTKSYGVAELKDLGCARVEFSGNAYDPTIHRPIGLSETDRVRFGADVGFVGSYERDRAMQILYLANAGIPVRVFGDMWDNFAESKHLLRPHEPPVYGDDYARVLCATKINLCFLRKANRDRQTQRSIEIPACGGFMLAERTSEHSSLFVEGREAEFFSSPSELKQKIEEYLANDMRREAIAAGGRKRCITGRYSYIERLDLALRSFDQS
jgi:spore maturation protein CgeB